MEAQQPANASNQESSTHPLTEPSSYPLTPISSNPDPPTPLSPPTPETTPLQISKPFELLTLIEFHFRYLNNTNNEAEKQKLVDLTTRFSAGDPSADQEIEDMYDAYFPAGECDFLRQLPCSPPPETQVMEQIFDDERVGEIHELLRVPISRAGFGLVGLTFPQTGEIPTFFEAVRAFEDLPREEVLGEDDPLMPRSLLEERRRST